MPFLFLIFAVFLSVPAFASDVVRVLSVDGPINPVTAEYLRENLHAADRDGDRLVIVEIDTPGGLDTAMRLVVKDFFAATVPVVAYVSPSGARAASAGAIICLAADFCAMAPGTAIGAAHPVALGEKPDPVMAAKILNDAAAYAEGIASRRSRNKDIAIRMVRESLSLAPEAAVREGVVDLVAGSRVDLVKWLDGKSLTRDGRLLVLRLADTRIVLHPMSGRQKILDAIGNPTVAYILLMLGFLGLFFELSNPGVILPGVVGGISLILGMFALQSLPVNYAGILLLILAFVLFIAETQIVSHGMLAVAGIASLILGSLFLFESPEPYLRASWGAIAATVTVVAGLAGILVVKAVRAQMLRPTTGAEGLVGERGRAATPLSPAGKVFLRGEYWNAVAAEPVAEGEEVEVVAVESLTVRVRRVEPLR